MGAYRTHSVDIPDHDSVHPVIRQVHFSNMNHEVQLRMGLDTGAFDCAEFRQGNPKEQLLYIGKRREKSGKQRLPKSVWYAVCDENYKISPQPVNYCDIGYT